MSTALSLLPVLGIVAAALYGAHAVVRARAALSAWRHRIVTALLLAPLLPIAAWAIGIPLPGWLAPLAVTVAAATAWRRFLRNGDVVTRWGEASRRKSGVASVRDIWRAASWWTLRRKATALRPSTRLMTRTARARLPLRELGARIARVGLLCIWAAIEDVTLVFGGPRTGKTGWLAGRVLDAPGACLVTSTRTDLYDLTAELRDRGPGTVGVFNPAGVGDRPSTITFDPLTGCLDPVTAVERATDLLAGNGDDDGDRGFWNGQGRRVLAALLHAAALGKGTLDMSDVARWVADPAAAERELLRLLRTSDVPGYITEVTQFIGTNDRTRTSITSTIMPALSWLTSPAARAATAPTGSVDVAAVLANRTTIYLFGAKDSHTAPLVAALTGYIAREARRLAALQPGGRLDPPLTLVLDEAALLAPPLEDWTADMGGRNVTIYAAFQSRAQLLSRWSTAQAAEILNNAATIMLFGGTNDRDDLEFWSTRAGDRDEPVNTTDNHGEVKSRTTRKAPVLTPSQLANLPERTVVVFRRGMPPVVGRAQMAWQRRDMRHRAGTDLRTRAAAVWRRMRRGPRQVPATWPTRHQPHRAPQPAAVLDTYPMPDLPPVPVPVPERVPARPSA